MYISSDIINKKIISIIIISNSIFLLIIARITYLQIHCADHLIARSKKNFIRHELINFPRGNIRDSKGNLLATNRPLFCLIWQGTGNRQLSCDQKNTLTRVEEITGIEILDTDLYKNILVAERKKQQLTIVTDIDSTILSKLSELFSNHNNVMIDTQFKRYYPYHNCASHVIGYLGNIRSFSHGQLGLEKIFNENLSGINGSREHIVNSSGQYLSQTQIIEGSSGENIDTTIDIDIQLLCEKVFPDNKVGSFIVFNPCNGAIVSLVSRPNFDPNIFLNPLSTSQWEKLQKDNPFLNRALDATYPSGSIFKLITISAALEHNIISTDTPWHCKGYTLFAKRKYWCAKRCGHGEISIKQAVAESCNTLFFEIAKKIDIDILAHYAHKFGLGEKTNIVFPEKTGLVPSREWKINCKGEPWWPGETLSVAIGQSFLLVTPIQIARMIGAIFTGTLLSPRLVITEPIIAHQLDIKPETISFLKKSMKMVVQHGTGKSVKKIKDMKIYAKTSTAQTSDFSKRKLDQKYLEHGWFVCHFHYKNHEPLVIVIVVERVGTAQVATTIAKNFFLEYKKYMDLLHS